MPESLPQSLPSSGPSKVVVIDNGTGFSKLGYCGNTAPSYIIPTAIAKRNEQRQQKAYKGMEDLDFYIGDEAVKVSETQGQSYVLSYPMKHGMISDWSDMELYWEQCFYKYLRCDPEDHYVLLTEPPLNPPENRESLAEIMFETYNVPGMYVAVQAVLALAASWTSKRHQELNLGAGQLTGTVIDSGDGVSHVIPVADGYVIGSSIKHIPLAGRDITQFVAKFMKEREKQIPQSQLYLTAQQAKEKYCYVCRNVAKEFHKFDQDPTKFKQWHGVYKGKDWTCDVGYERFLGPEVFFNPEIFSSDFTTPLSAVVDQCIQSCPIDYRKQLYRNIVLSGGSTMFQNFDKRLEVDIKALADDRISRSRSKKSSRPAKKMEVNVISHALQRWSVWFGGSVLANTGDQFFKVCHTREQYNETGPSIARYSQVFQNM